MLASAYYLLAGWFEQSWAVAISFALLFVPLFVDTHAAGEGIVYVYRWLLEYCDEPFAAQDTTFAHNSGK